MLETTLFQIIVLHILMSVSNMLIKLPININQTKININDKLLSIDAKSGPPTSTYLTVLLRA